MAEAQVFLGDAEQLPFLDKSVDLVIGSPPYCKARTYGIGAQRGCTEWIGWMLRCTQEALRVSKGPVLWVAAGTGNYEPAVEGLIYRAWESGIEVLRPCIWTANKPPTGRGWFSNDWEFVAAFTSVRPLPHWNPEAIGTPLKYRAGGDFRQRKQDGTRGQGGKYPTHKLRKRPSNVIHATVGGGHLGSKLAHENEAPFPENIVRPFILALCPPGGVVLDPFAGSGTTGATAIAVGRNALLVDIRINQCNLARRRLAEIGAMRNGTRIFELPGAPSERRAVAGFFENRTDNDNSGSG